LILQRCLCKILLIPHLDSVKWQQGVTFQKASMASCQVSYTIGASKKAIALFKFAIAA